ncbi:MAG: proline dehydrogenase family protein [Weeksellaceae bacterium]|nr:proline dehydrogenase family protein [Weeksellaceae bacterium]
MSNNDLRKAYGLFKSVANPSLVTFGAWFLKFGKHLPGMRYLLKNTIYSHFCGGETITDSLQTVEKLHTQNVYSILDFSVEGKEEEAEYDHCRDEILRNVDLSRQRKEIPFVVFKPTGFGNIQLYTKVSEGKELTDAEKVSWQRIVERFDSVCRRAYDNDVTIMIDAEESWLQPAADKLAEDLMQRYNQHKCIVVNTLQMYRHDRLAYLKSEFERAKQGNYKIGYKVVRGAYIEKEQDRAAKLGYPSPIQPNKEATDHDYNQALEFITAHHDTISLFAGTHNEVSSKLLMDLIDQHGFSHDYHKMWFGQLLGMSDNISFVVADKGYNVAKYVPYGPLNDVMPYLMRRAQENTSVAGQSSRELLLIEKELHRRGKRF